MLLLHLYLYLHLLLLLCLLCLLLHHKGSIQDVRTFGEQVKHVACANEAWAKQMVGEKPPARCDIGGPNPAKTKTEILSYLHDSFTMINKVIAETNAENLLHPNAGPYWGSNRLSALTATVLHISDHYGQLVEYLRMNGIVPPASRKYSDTESLGSASPDPASCRLERGGCEPSSASCFPFPWYL
jgi:hypothetical protein